MRRRGWSASSSSNDAGGPPEVGGRADPAAPVERLHGLGSGQAAAVVDPAERMDAAVLRGDVEGRERARREVGVGG
jgi:hypothetical protein